MTAPQQPEGGISRSRPLPPDEAERLDVAIERLGVDANRISVEGEPPRGMEEVGQVDRAVIGHQVRRALLGAVVGSLLLLALAVVVQLVWTVPPGAVIIPAVIIGAILGGLWSLYGGLPANPAIPDVNASEQATIRADRRGLDPEMSRRIDTLVDEAGTGHGKHTGHRTG